MKYWYRLAGMTVEVVVPDEQRYENEGALAIYAMDGLAEDLPENPTEELVPDYMMTIQMAEELPSPEGECVFCDSAMIVYQQGTVQTRYKGPTNNGTADTYMWIRREGRQSQILLRKKYYQRVTTKVILDAMEAEHRIVEQGGFLFHSSCIRVGEEAVLFTAPSGTGKSTQADLWEQYRGAEIINGDRIAILTGSHIRIAGIPYSGSSGISKNVILPLRAIVYLSQAPQTTIRPMTGREAFCRLWEGICVNTWDRQDVDRCIELVQQVIAQVPIYHLACTPDESAIRALEQMLQ